MPRTSTARKTARAETPEQVGRLSLHSIPTARAEALDRLHRGGRTLPVTVAGEGWVLSPLWPVPEASGEVTHLRVAAGGETVSAALPSEVVAALVKRFAPEAELSRLSAAHRVLLFEAALEADIARVETALSSDIRFEAAGTAGEAADIAFQVTVGEQGFVVSAAEVPTVLLRRIADLFGAEGKASATVVDLPLPIRICRDAVMLTLGELRGLRAGDVVMLDGEDGAFAIIADRLVAPLAVEAGRTRLVSQPVAIATSQWDWIMTETPPMPASGLEEGALDDVPVTVVFELARKTLAVSEIKTLTAGAIVTLPEVARETVELVANGRRVGQGEIVRVGEGLGVRILSMSANAG